MVKLNRIYTRTGDDGTTGLIPGGRVAKHSLRITAIGSVDEANSALGVARLYVRDTEEEMLRCIQNDLFDLGADLATPEPYQGTALRIIATQVKRLEQEIDAMNAMLTPLNSFVLPGGSEASSHVHVARATVRRAERDMVALAQEESVGLPALHYINRLSDHLFTLARFLNAHGKKDVLWQPGLNRKTDE